MFTTCRIKPDGHNLNIRGWNESKVWHRSWRWKNPSCSSDIRVTAKRRTSEEVTSSSSELDEHELHRSESLRQDGIRWTRCQRAPVRRCVILACAAWASEDKTHAMTTAVSLSVTNVPIKPVPFQFDSVKVSRRIVLASDWNDNMWEHHRLQVRCHGVEGQIYHFMMDITGIVINIATSSLHESSFLPVSMSGSAKPMIQIQATIDGESPTPTPTSPILKSR